MRQLASLGAAAVRGPVSGPDALWRGGLCEGGRRTHACSTTMATKSAWSTRRVNQSEDSHRYIGVAGESAAVNKQMRPSHCLD